MIGDTTLNTKIRLVNDMQMIRDIKNNEKKIHSSFGIDDHYTDRETVQFVSPMDYPLNIIIIGPCYSLRQTDKYFWSRVCRIFY